MSRKVFTAGEVLAAADVNSFLMDQTVMSFAGTAARGSAIPSPVEGMYSHLEDTDRLEFWNGSAWRSPLGMTLIATSTFTNQTTVNITGCFSAQYDNYRIVLNVNAAANATASIRARMLSGTTPATTSYQASQQNWNYGSGAYQNSQSETVWFALGWMSPTGSVASSSVFDICRPFQAANTSIHGSYTGDAFNAYSAFGFYAGGHNVGTSYDGLQLIGNSANLTGTARVYGYRNA